MPEDTQLTVRVSENTGLSNTLMDLENAMERAARENLNAVLSGAGTDLAQYTELEQMAMVVGEKLRLVDGLDLAAIMLRGKLLHQIEDQALFTVHPEHFDTLEAMAQAQNISLSELSDIRQMYDVVFPYIETTLGMSVAEAWDRIGKSNFRALVPYLKAIITGDQPARGSTRDNYNRILDETAASLMAQNSGVRPDDQTIRRQAVDDLLLAGQQMTARQVQEHLRDGAVTPALNPTIIVGPDGQKYLLAPVDDDQLLVVRRKMGAYCSDPTLVNLPQNQRLRQTEALRNALIRDFSQMLEG
jgi:hypothetical protein